MWLWHRKQEIDAGTWEPPEVVEARQAAERQARVLFGDYARSWLADRDIKPRTRSSYRVLLDRLILPELADVAVADLGVGIVRSWYAGLDKDKQTTRTRAYELVRAIMNDAVREELAEQNPCMLTRADKTKTKPKRQRFVPLSPAELHALADAMPAKHKAAVLISGWCGLRFGELTELRRGDVDLKAGTISVERAVVRADGQIIVGEPKSDAGVRVVAIPPHIIDDLKAHMRRHAQWGSDGLLFPAKHGGHLASSTLYGKPARQVKSKRTGKTYNKPAWGFHRAREAIGRPDLRWHDLRHTGATLAAVSGASLRELQARLGHSTTQAAMVYQHVADGRDAEIAAKLSDMWEATR